MIKNTCAIHTMLNYKFHCLLYQPQCIYHLTLIKHIAEDTILNLRANKMKIIIYIIVIICIVITCSIKGYASEMKSLLPKMFELSTFDEVIQPNLTEPEIQLCVNKHNDLRRLEGAANMYHMVSLLTCFYNCFISILDFNLLKQYHPYQMKQSKARDVYCCLSCIYLYA
jgi:hypothetical protein